MKTIYFDNAATTQLDPRVLETMLPWLTQDFGNAASIHHLGRKATVAVEEAREKIAHFIGATPAEIIFTSGGTESDNTVIQSVSSFSNRKKVISSVAEHHAILNPVEQKLENGILLPVSKLGIVSVEQIEKLIASNDVALISLMHVNNENGAINPVNTIAEIAQKNGILFHSDVVQSAGKFEINVQKWPVDFLSMSAHKLHGPKGTGLLYARAGSDLIPFMKGGSQERKRRAGTLNVPGIVGFGKAFELAHAELHERKNHISALKHRLESGLEALFGNEIVFNNPRGNDAYHIVNISFNFSDGHFLDGEMLLLNLDIEGICCSNGSACTSGAVEPSHVLLAMGVPAKVAKSSLRLSLSKNNTVEEIDFTLEKLDKIVKRMRKK